MSIRRHDVLIIGSGFAGAATAFHLSRSFSGSIAIVEREKVPGAHASGRNASLLFQAVGDPAVRGTAASSRAAYCELRGDVGFHEVGSWLLGSRELLEQAREPELVDSRFLDPGEVVRRVPVLGGHHFEAALATPGDGVIDTWALLNVYLDGARSRGVEICYDCEVREISAGTPFRLETSRGEIEAGCLVNAAGAWAGELAARAGVRGPELVAYKRHLFVLDGIEPMEPDWPFVWSLGPDFYFRPESGGTLFSICDEERSSHLAATVSPGISEALAELVSDQLPRFEGARIRSVWSCFRTKSEDDRFVIGRDPVVEDFVWVAGLGGHGMGSSWEIGRLASEAILGNRAPEVSAFDPGRFGPGVSPQAVRCRPAG